MMPFALITGGGKGIGKCIAADLAKKNYHVLLVARDEKTLEEPGIAFGEYNVMFSERVTSRKFTPVNSIGGSASNGPQVGDVVWIRGYVLTWQRSQIASNTAPMTSRHGQRCCS
jgi:NAD(P)-dependent dehydrogenase (short-subunit alcohol dehydrogenase family)